MPETKHITNSTYVYIHTGSPSYLLVHDPPSHPIVCGCFVFLFSAWFFKSCFICLFFVVCTFYYSFTSCLAALEDMAIISEAKITLSSPLYACEFDPQDSSRLAVAGGGGSSRSGVGNKIVSLFACPYPLRCWWFFSLFTSCLVASFQESHGEIWSAVSLPAAEVRIKLC